MNQETAQALFNQGAFLLFLNAPKGLEVVIKEWDPSIEDIKKDEDMDPEQNERLKSDMRQFDQFLGAYPLSPPTNWQKWVHLTDFITPLLIDGVLPNKGRLNNASSSTVDEEELQNIGESNFKEDTMMFTKFDVKKSWRSGAVGQEITKYSQDKSWLLEDLLKRTYRNGSRLRLNYFNIVQTLHKNIMELMSSTEPSFSADAQQSKKLHNLRRKFDKFCSFLYQRFQWEIAKDDSEDEEEEGEYAPVVVELSEENNEVDYISEFPVV
ncbi:6477_t:CDS:2 [Acaulospora colombiana]|uniref:6477_t:CDS:1 n=1 Tax=Acaulospora colombiana TaxID=27376 RepID=A0ACA9KS32_9GLOM|nr:6477_t:CDS:2 [Acaulospora colombiana]